MAKWKLVSRHEYEFASAFPRYVRALVFFFAGLAVTAGGVALFVFGGGRSHIPYMIGGILVLFGLLFMFLGALLWPWAGVRWVRLYEEGLRWKDRRGEHKKRWEEVVSVSRNETQTIDIHGTGDEFGREADFGLCFDDDSSINFTTTLARYDRLARYVQEQVAARQQAGAEAEFASEGKTFGIVRIDRDGITALANGRHYAWDEVEWLQVDNGHLCAAPSCRGWEPVPLAGISNYLVLLSIVQKLGRLRE